MIIRCKDCNRELQGHPTRTKCCGCPNMATIRGDRISALDLSHVVMVESNTEAQKSSLFSAQDLAFQEARRKRKVKRLDFEIR